MKAHTLNLHIAILTAALTLGAGSLTAADIPVANASFEVDHVTPGNWRVMIPDGWTIYDPHSIVDQNNDVVGAIDPAGTPYFTSIPDGLRAGLVYLANDTGTGQEAGLSQVLDATLEPWTEYVLTVEVGNIASGTALPPLDVLGYFNLAGFPGYRIELLAGDEVIAVDDNTLNIQEAEWETATARVSIGATHDQLGMPLSIRLINLNLPGTEEEPGIEVDFDDVRLVSQPVAQPRLTIRQEAENLVIAWEDSLAPGFQLQTTASLVPPISWVPVMEGILAEGPSRSLVLPAADGTSPAQFFRLIQPGTGEME